MNNKVKILVAEDELLIAMDIKQKLEDIGYEVTSLVSTAIEAITKSETDKPGIILMDIQLSGSLNGIEAAHIITYKHKIPIIFLTSVSNENVLLQDKKFSTFEHISKPIDIMKLQKVINNIKEKMMLPANAMKDNFSQPSTFTY